MFSDILSVDKHLTKFLFLAEVSYAPKVKEAKNRIF